MNISKEFGEYVQKAIQEPDLANLLGDIQKLGTDIPPAQLAQLSDRFNFLSDESKLLALQALATLAEGLNEG